VPGHWEGDLVFGARPSAVATLVDRGTRYAMVVALPDGNKADAVTAALIEHMGRLPAPLRRSFFAEIGDITRFSSSAKLARCTGCAPIPVYSSDHERHRLHRAGNRRLNSVIYTAAIVQKRFTPAAAELTKRHQPTKGTRGARRILQRHLVDVIHRAMHIDQTSWQHQITKYQPPR
jgi:hypothetical protein